MDTSFNFPAVLSFFLYYEMFNIFTNFSPSKKGGGTIEINIFQKDFLKVFLYFQNFKLLFNLQSKLIAKLQSVYLTSDELQDIEQW